MPFSKVLCKNQTGCMLFWPWHHSGIYLGQIGRASVLPSRTWIWVSKLLQRVTIGRRFAAALLPRLFGKNPRSHHKGATGRVRTGNYSYWTPTASSSMPLPTWTRHRNTSSWTKLLSRWRKAGSSLFRLDMLHIQAMIWPTCATCLSTCATCLRKVRNLIRSIIRATSCWLRQSLDFVRVLSVNQE